MRLEQKINRRGIESCIWLVQCDVRSFVGYNPASHTFSQVMRSACIVGPSKKSQAGLSKLDAVGIPDRRFPAQVHLGFLFLLLRFPFLGSQACYLRDR